MKTNDPSENLASQIMHKLSKVDLEGEEAKEIYAHFGLAYYWSNCLESGIANTLCFLKLYTGKVKVSSKEEWEILVDKHFQDSFEKTLGILKKEVANHAADFPQLTDLIIDLNMCIVERNYIAHHFFRDYARCWYTAHGRTRMMVRLESARELFRSIDIKLDAIAEPIMRKHGLTNEKIEEIMSELMTDDAEVKH